MQAQVQTTGSAKVENRWSGALGGYDPGPFYCEMLRSAARSGAIARVAAKLDALPLETLRARAGDAETELYNLGITFTVYSEKDAIDRILPFDVIPRILTRGDWQHIERGTIQRVQTLNLFLHDIYHDQKCIRDGIIPADLVLGNANYRKEMEGLDLPFGTYVHVNGIDLVRGRDGTILVLEDNARSPSGVSYVVENRHLMMRAFADLMENVPIMKVSDYGQRLHHGLSELASAAVEEPQVVLLSPGVFNSAYFEHVFLAREMGVPLVEGRDLFVDDDRVFMKTIAGPMPVDVIYRRLNDDFLDPEAFNPDSMLGVRGLMRAYARGNVQLANAPGTGVADDKAIYAYLPRLVRYYLDQDAILPNVETLICREQPALQQVLDRLDQMVVKPVGESGGYGITIGPKASKVELDDQRAKLLANPANFIAQPMIDLSVCPTLTDDGIEPRHVDLRPFAITGKSTWVLPGGLSRVALRKGSLVVNSSQGGGSKDTWVLREDVA
jgi:uncharacterized circularly permuted ATP-grasp superfamily protein